MSASSVKTNDDDDVEHDTIPERTYKQERVRVDRKLLEYILLSSSFKNEQGHHIFRDMETQYGVSSINPDQHFKIGAKSKKDPIIRIIAGLDVEDSRLLAAKHAVEDLFDPNRNRITIQIDEAQEQHFFVIGKKGDNSKRIMSQSGCHIHFPDHRGQSHKSQMISILGRPDGADLARRLVRGCMPITFSLPAPSHIPQHQLQMTDDVKLLSSKHQVTIFFKNHDGKIAVCCKAARNQATNALVTLKELFSLWDAVLPNEIRVTVDISRSLRQYLFQDHSGLSFYKDLNRRYSTSPQPARLSASMHNSQVSATGHPKSCLNIINEVLSYSQISATFDVPEAWHHHEGLSSYGVASQLISRFHDQHLQLIAASDQTVRVSAFCRHCSAIYLFRQYFMEFGGLACAPRDLDQMEISMNPAIVDSVIDDPNLISALENWHQPASTSMESSITLSPSTSDASSPTTPLQEQAKSTFPPPFTSTKSSSHIPREKKQEMAKKALENPDFSQPRRPTDYFSGAGLSQSVPAHEWKKMREKMKTNIAPVQEEEKRGIDRISSTMTSPSQSMKLDNPSSRLQAWITSRQSASSESLSVETSTPPGLEIPSANEIEQHQQDLLNASLNSLGLTEPSSSNEDLSVYSSMPQSQEVVEYWQVQTLEELLDKLKLENYKDMMQDQEVDLATFMTLSDTDLKEIGVKAFGARRRMLMAIANLDRLHNQDQSFLGRVYKFTHQ